MLEMIICLAIGAFIGWNFPQPPWAKVVQEKIINMFNKGKTHE